MSYKKIDDCIIKHMKSKTIILSAPQNDHNGRGILTIYEEDDLLKCKLRLYNTPNLSRFCKLGVYHQKEVSSANLLEKNGVYTSSLVGDFDIEKDFYTAIIDTEHENTVILAGGTYAGFFYNDQSNVFSHINKENPNTNLFDYDNQDYENEEIESAMNFDKNEAQNQIKCATNDEDKCKNCKYKEYFYSCNQPINTEIKCENEEENVVINLNKESNQIEESNQEKTQTILSALLPQFDYVFNNYEADETLNNLIPNSKFVKINENQEQYSIGAIYEEEKMRYICYAVMKDYNVPATQELGKHYQWLPLDKEDPLSEGYYIVFQDASDLKIVEL